MLFIYYLIGSLACTYGAFTISVPKSGVSIVGGQNATIEEAPYQVVLQLFLVDFWCGGVIIAKDVILTSAHCTEDMFPENFRVRAGSSFHNSGGQLRNVNRIIVHSDYGIPSYGNNDISLMFLKSDLVLGPTVAIATLPAQGETVNDGELAFITGWGALSDGGPYPDQLQKLTTPIVNQKQCSDALAATAPVTENMICAGGLDDGGHDICYGDSGSPLMVRNVLFGIASWGAGCAPPKIPSVYTRVANYRTWIDEHMKS